MSHNVLREFAAMPPEEQGEAIRRSEAPRGRSKDLEARRMEVCFRREEVHERMRFLCVRLRAPPVPWLSVEARPLSCGVGWEPCIVATVDAPAWAAAWLKGDQGRAATYFDHADVSYPEGAAMASLNLELAKIEAAIRAIDEEQAKQSRPPAGDCV